MRTLLTYAALVLALGLPLAAADNPAPPFSYPKEYSADVTLAHGQDPPAKVKLYVANGKVRVTLPDASVAIILLSQAQLVHLIPAEKTYSTEPANPALIGPLTTYALGPDANSKVESQGAEAVAGVDCTKYQATLADGNTVTYWVSTKSRQPVKVSTTVGPVNATMDNIQAGPQDAALFAVPPEGYTKGLSPMQRIVIMQQSRQIGISLFSYANDNNGAYPPGKTSTEVFQKLIDGGYVTDPSIFYFPMDGKSPAEKTAKTITAANVCFDFTAGLTNDSSDATPELFSTGYVVSYGAGATAKPAADATSPLHGMMVFSKSNQVHFQKASDDGTLPNFTPAGFDPGKNTYQQLRP